MRRTALTTLLACLLVSAFSAAALGSAFYNQSNTGKPNPAELWFSCGVFCGNHFSIAPGDSAARPGKGGKFYLVNHGGFSGKPSSACSLDERSVQKHGRAVLKYSSNRYHWALYGTGGTAIGPPSPIEFGIYNDDPEDGPVGCVPG